VTQAHSPSAGDKEGSPKQFQVKNTLGISPTRIMNLWDKSLFYNHDPNWAPNTPLKIS
jgi:hypothetical protein